MKKTISILFVFVFSILFSISNISYITNAEDSIIAKGIDVSKHNGDIDWNQVHNAGVQFAIIRTSYGWSNREKQTDCKLLKNINGAKAVGIPIGAYHYSYATNPTEAIWEADFFLDRLKWTQWEYPVCLDIEDHCQLKISTQQRTDVAITFLDRVRSAGYYVAIYANLNWTKNYLDMNRLSGYDLWIAHWNPKCGCQIPYSMWQYTSSGMIPGIGVCDLDYAYKDYPTYIKSNHLNGF